MNTSATDNKPQQTEVEGTQAEKTAMPNYASPEERMANIEKQLGVGRFAGQQAISLVLTFGGAALGFLAGKGAGKAGLGREITLEEGVSVNTSSAIGAIAGFIMGGIASGYRGWRKLEGERLAVQEINKDVAAIMESRVAFEDTLRAQGEVVSEMRMRVEAMPEPVIGEKAAAELNRRATATEEQRIR